MSEFLGRLEEDNCLGVRDRALFELMYSSGLRCSDISGLTLGDVDTDNRELLVRRGKFGKDRVVPISEVAALFLKRYIGNRKKKDEPVFWSRTGPLTSSGIGRRFRDLVKNLGLYKKGVSAHSVRHSTATHLLEHGAGIRYVAELLGHENMQTTVRYTHMLPENLKRVYRQYHPRENECFREVDEGYVKRIQAFEQLLMKSKRGIKISKKSKLDVRES